MTAPLLFQPLFMERVWGGQKLLSAFGKPLDQTAVIGESWEIVDRPQAQSIVVSGPLAGTSLHDLWSGGQRRALFGSRARAWGERFPLLLKLLDCSQTLSVQVHPPAGIAPMLGGEPKTEMWVIADAAADAHLLVGLGAGVDRAAFELQLRAGGDVSALLHRIDVSAGDAMFLPSGRIHAIGAGNLIVEIQQNSDTTYRVYDFNRPGLDGNPRELHIDESLASIDFEDHEPSLIDPDGELLIECEAFRVERWFLKEAISRHAAPDGEFAIVCCLSGCVRCAGVELGPGHFALVCADTPQAVIAAEGGNAVALQITLPSRSP
jgi:mannose-6-phosphate isomerase